jgi:hypothetical protein
MSEIILRVAQIISNNKVPCGYTKVPCGGDMIDCNCCRVACKIITAMREPTKPMIDANTHANSRAVIIIWHTMIDEALR